MWAFFTGTLLLSQTDNRAGLEALAYIFLVIGCIAIVAGLAYLYYLNRKKSGDKHRKT